MGANKLPLRERKRQQREAAMIACAEALLAEKGYDGMSIDDVIDAVEMSKPTFYSHFASKEALAIRVIVAGLEHARERLDAFERSLPPEEAARAMITWAIDNQFGSAGRPELSWSLAFYDKPEIREAENKLTEQLARLINAAQQANGTEVPASPEFLSRAFRSILKDTQFWGEMGGDGEKLDQLKRDMLAIIMPGSGDRS